MNFAVFLKPPVSPVPGAPIPLFPKHAWPGTARVRPTRCMPSGTAATTPNSTAFPIRFKRPAAAVYSPEGKQQTRELIDYYLENAALVRREIGAMGFDLVGGENSPYIWLDTRTDAWEFFDLLLEKAGVVCTPGPGFGNAAWALFASALLTAVTMWKKPLNA